MNELIGLCDMANIPYPHIGHFITSILYHDIACFLVIQYIYSLYEITSW